MYMPNTFHNTTPRKATTVRVKTIATLIKVILISRTWSLPSRALVGYRLAYERLLARLLFPIHVILLCPTREVWSIAQTKSSTRGRLSDVISDELERETEIAATVDLAREDWPQWRTVA